MIRIGDREQFATIRRFLQSAYPDDYNILADRVGDFDPAKHGDEPLRRSRFGTCFPISD